MEKIRLAIAEDNEKFRKAIIRHILMERDLEVILEAENGQHLLEQLKTIVPDVILMDIRMPIMDGVETTSKVTELYPHLVIIAYSQYDQEENIIKMNAHGVKSFIGKEDDVDELFKAIRIVHKGGIYMTSKAAEIIQKYLKRALGNSQHPIELTEVEIALLNGICKGFSSTKLAKTIHKSPRTIDDYRTNLYQKFQVENKEQLIAKVVALKLIQIY